MCQIFGVNICKEVTNMTNYREILRLHSLGLNKTEIAAIALGTPLQQRYSERQLFRKITWGLAMGSMALYLIMRITISVHYSVAFGVGILLVAVLQLPCALNELLSKIIKNSCLHSSL